MAYIKMTKSKFNAAKILFQSGAIIQKMNELLAAISNKLAFIVDELTK